MFMIILIIEKHIVFQKGKFLSGLKFNYFYLKFISHPMEKRMTDPNTRTYLPQISRSAFHTSILDIISCSLLILDKTKQSKKSLPCSRILDNVLDKIRWMSRHESKNMDVGRPRVAIQAVTDQHESDLPGQIYRAFDKYMSMQDELVDLRQWFRIGLVIAWPFGCAHSWSGAMWSSSKFSER